MTDLLAGSGSAPRPTGRPKPVRMLIVSRQLGTTRTPFCEGSAVDDDALDGCRLGAQQVFGATLKFRSLCLKRCMTYCERGTDKEGSIVERFSRDVDDDLPVLPKSNQPEPVPINK